MKDLEVKLIMLLLLALATIFVESQENEVVYQTKDNRESSAVTAASDLYLPGDVTKYPMKSLQCFSSLTKPDKELICPAARY